MKVAELITQLRRNFTTSEDGRWSLTVWKHGSEQKVGEVRRYACCLRNGGPLAAYVFLETHGTTVEELDKNWHFGNVDTSPLAEYLKIAIP